MITSSYNRYWLKGMTFNQPLIMYNQIEWMDEYFDMPKWKNI